MQGQNSHMLSAPEHVPAERVFDFDFIDPPGAEEDVHQAWLSVRDQAPDVFWTPRNGGHWVAARAEAIKEVQSDYSRFSSKRFVLPVHPDGAKESTLLGSDPPEHGAYRKIIMPSFLPKAVNQMEILARKVAVERIQEIAPRGECEFMSAFARYLPAAVVMDLFGLPIEDVPMLLPIAETMVRYGNAEERRAAFDQIDAYLAIWIEKRLADPGEDLLSLIVHAKVGDRPVNASEMKALSHVLFAGLDTVGTMMGFFANFLATHPEHRRDLVAHPEIRANAVEELIRRHGVANTARCVVSDIEFHGAFLKAGDMIQIPSMLYGLDERIVDDPLKVDFRRKRFPLGAFGNGPHSCPGAVLARRELTVFIDEWLPRIPDFEIRSGSTPRMASGSVVTIRDLDLIWDPASVRL